MRPTQRSGAPPQGPAATKISPHHGTDHKQGNPSTPSGVTIPPPQDWADLLDEIERLVYAAAGIEVTGRTVVWRDGRAVIERDPPTSGLPAVDSSAWWEAPARIRIAALVLLSWEHLTGQRQLAEQQKAVSVAISGGMDWSAAAHHLAYSPYGVLAQRCREPGPLARPVDPDALARWVETGSSREGTAA